MRTGLGNRAARMLGKKAVMAERRMAGDLGLGLGLAMAPAFP